MCIQSTMHARNIHTFRGSSATRVLQRRLARFTSIRPRILAIASRPVPPTRAREYAGCTYRTFDGCRPSAYASRIFVIRAACCRHRWHSSSPPILATRANTELRKSTRARACIWPRRPMRAYARFHLEISESAKIDLNLMIVCYSSALLLHTY